MGLWRFSDLGFGGIYESGGIAVRAKLLHEKIQVHELLPVATAFAAHLLPQN